MFKMNHEMKRRKKLLKQNFVLTNIVVSPYGNTLFNQFHNSSRIHINKSNRDKKIMINSLERHQDSV